MRRLLAVLLFTVIAGGLVVADQRSAAPAAAPQAAPAAKAAATPAFQLTVDSIMRGPKLVGAAPSAIRFAPDSSKIFFSWQKAGETRASQYVVNRDGSDLKAAGGDDGGGQAPLGGRFDGAHKRTLAAENGDIVMYDVATRARHQLTRTSAVESAPRWARHDTAITFMRDGNLFVMSLAGSELTQLTDVIAAPEETVAVSPAAAGGGGGRGGRGGRGGQAAAAGVPPARGGAAQGGQTDSQKVMSQEEMALIQHLQEQNGGRGGGGQGGGRGGRGGNGGAAAAPQTPIARFQLQARQSVTDMMLSADEKFVFIGVNERPAQNARTQDVWNYVTASSYPEVIPGRPDVGDVQAKRLLAMVDVKAGTTVWADGSFAGNEKIVAPGATAGPRVLDWGLPDTSDDGAQYVLPVRSQDFKDRWFAHIDPATGKVTVLDNLHDDAWVREVNLGAAGGGAGFGGGGGAGAGGQWLPDNKHFMFLAEKDGWMHLYSLDVTAGAPAKQLTSGKWEITSAALNADRTKVYLTSTEVHPGERHFYAMSVDGGARTQITSMTGENVVTVSPDEKSLAIVYSYSNKPPELYTMPLTAGAKATQVTTTPSEEFRSFKWIDPKVITFKARDGAMVYARLFTPEMIGAKRDPHHPAVVFVHGAGYLQNAHKYWATSYYREYMFNNLLASRGYVVIDPDYRASSGYGRDWRTAIYEHMGGKDLDDAVDAAKFVVSTEQVDPKRIGIYGGSYGGFLTLMALFTSPDTFMAGAALRPVTDWTHYNHGYTAPILNLPQNDLEAYKRSSPIYFADGLKNHLLICHGMVDTNVPFQDSVRLVQRLIELRKTSFEFAPFPVEDHTFTDELSWASEYTRILRLFEDDLRK